ncbi:hypothetical protein [Rhodospirillum centenum]|uniref:Uncharacterized protein n=1 Tax=Rhodospirillum centenum (strain ATCC 51521 / SW) TaxID=414684 RepID=B6IS35_RHOCS|nr:hypothetical protein [Rhodospirillum centenum]ACI98271.1 hypothetical protein RC1_0841 [Rhodospirillum centenum SW]
MTHDPEILIFARRLVQELGGDAITLSRVKLVELTAANHVRGARFWRGVMQACQHELKEREEAAAPLTPALPPEPVTTPEPAFKAAC